MNSSEHQPYLSNPQLELAFDFVQYTGQNLFLTGKAEPEALEIISRYKGKKRLLRYSEIYSTSVNFNSSLNQVLKTIGKDIGIDGLTMYHARHTWATLASNELNATDDEVGEALGHSKKTVTTGYINRNPEKVDILNRKVLDLLK